MNAFRTNRSFIKVFFLSLITFGIYSLVMMHHMTNELNIIAGKRDGKKSMNYLLMTFLLTPFTLGIGTLVWYHKFSERLGNELRARGIAYKFGSGTYWGWNILGALIGIGPIVYQVKLIKAMNLMNADYNQKG